MPKLYDTLDKIEKSDNPIEKKIAVLSFFQSIEKSRLAIKETPALDLSCSELEAQLRDKTHKLWKLQQFSSRHSLNRDFPPLATFS